MRQKGFNWGLVLAFAVSIGIWVLFLTLCCCHPVSSVMEPELVMDGGILGSQINGMPFLKGHVTNIGGDTAYEAVLNLRILETNDMFRIALGDVGVGDKVAWEQKLKGYSWGDDINVNYSFSWRGK